MIKARCDKCSQLFLGESCTCSSGKRSKPIQCECGNPAVEILVDKFGEWPLCADCLALEQDEFAPLPLPVHQETQEKEEWEPPEESGSGEQPFGLTMREYEVACLSYLPDREIARVLSCSIHTVMSHMRSVRMKLGVHSRDQVRRKLFPNLCEEQKLNEQYVRRSGYPPLSVRIMIAGQVYHFSEIISLIYGAHSPLDRRSSWETDPPENT